MTNRTSREDNIPLLVGILRAVWLYNPFGVGKCCVKEATRV
jgi:hypothetical protein